MKLLSLHVDGFGKLRDFDYKFTPGVNCIISENGSGKTTLAVFIKSMLYGLAPNTKRDLSQNEYKHYTPWDGGAFGGSLDVETEKGKFRIYRTFGDKPSFELTDLSTGNPSDAYGENVGLELFGVDAGSFEKSVYLPQREINIVKSPDIDAKLGGLLESSDDVARYDVAKDALTKYASDLKHQRGEGGKIYETSRRRAEVLEDLTKAMTASEDAERLKEELGRVKSRAEELGNALSELEKEREEARKDSERRRDYGFYLEYLDKAEKAKERFEEYKKKKIPSDAEISEHEKILDEIRVLKNTDARSLTEAEGYRLDDLREKYGDPDRAENEYAGLKKKLADIKSEEEKLSSLAPPEVTAPAPKRRIAATAATIGGAIALAVGVVICFAGSIVPGLILTGLGLAVFALGLEMLNKSNKATKDAKLKAENEAAERKQLAEELAGRRRALEKEYSTDDLPGLISRAETEIEDYRRLLRAESSDAEKKKERAEKIGELADKLDRFFDEYSVDVQSDYREAFETAKKRVIWFEAAEKEAARTAAEAEEFAKKHGINTDGTPYDETGDGIDEQPDERSEAVNEELAKLRTYEGSVTARIAALEENAEAIPALTEEKARLEAKLAEYEKNHRNAEAAAKFLEQARANLSSRYITEMTADFEENYAKLSGRKAENTEVSSDFAVKLRDGGAKRDPSWYSEGMRSVINLCLRLALTDALFEGEKPFMILDDPFTELDGARLEAALDTVRRLGEERQTVYFTCHESRAIKN